MIVMRRLRKRMDIPVTFHAIRRFKQRLGFEPTVEEIAEIGRYIKGRQFQGDSTAARRRWLVKLRNRFVEVVWDNDGDTIVTMMVSTLEKRKTFSKLKLRMNEPK